MRKNSEAASEEIETTKDKQLWRDLVGFWILGLCNNFGYVVMLSAAHDINARFENVQKSEVFQRQCHLVSTGAILLADVIPCLVVELFMPFLPFWVNVRVISATFLTSMSFLMVAFSDSHMIAVIGVACTSASNGLGESTFLSYTSNYNRNAVSTWSSGMGGAGIIGSIAYAGLTHFDFTLRETMLIMMLVPALQCVAFWVVLRKPQVIKNAKSINVAITPNSNEPEGLAERIKYMGKLMKYMCPLLFVYISQYFINQGLFELEYFANTFLDKESQYRWLCADYQIGVFISRSSVNIISFRMIWVFAVLQVLNVAYFLTEVIFYYTPSIWIPFAVVMWEGLLGGGAYVNTFNRMLDDIPKPLQKFAIGATVQADSLGTMIAGFLALPVHNAICRLPEYERLTFS